MYVRNPIGVSQAPYNDFTSLAILLRTEHFKKTRRYDIKVCHLAPKWASSQIIDTTRRTSASRAEKF